MGDIGDALKDAFEQVLEMTGQTVIIHKHWNTSQHVMFEAKGLKDSEKKRGGQVIFRFPEGTDVDTGDVLQSKAGRDLWRVEDVEDYIKDDVFINLEAYVVKISSEGKEVRRSVGGHTVIHGDVYGGVQSGGQGNVQNVSISSNTSFVKAIRELNELVNDSPLPPVSKIEAQSDIQALERLGQLDRTPEVTAAAKSRVESIEKTISLTADMVSLGMPVITIIRAFFGV